MGNPDARHWLVVGGGFRGIMCAHQLLARGERVSLVESGKDLGGVLYPLDWAGFALDKGCHLFDNADDVLTSALFSLTPANAFKPLNVKYASAVVEEHISTGMAIADFSVCNTSFKAQSLLELVQAAATHDADKDAKCTNLAEVMQARFGKQLGVLVASAFKKAYQISADQIAPTALDLTVFRRIKLVSDEMGRLLKMSPALDERLAISSQQAPLLFYKDALAYGHRNFYPKGGLGAWCELARQRLIDEGCELYLQSRVGGVSRLGDQLQVSASGKGSAETIKINCDQVIWSSGAAHLEGVLYARDDISKLSHQVPMVLYYFKVRPDQFTGLTYMHDFRAHSLAYRLSAPGFYGDQLDEAGNSYLCIEVPTQKGSEIWSNPDAALCEVWSQAETTGLVTGSYLAVKWVRTPVSYGVPKVGFDQALAKLQVDIPRDFPNLHLMAGLSFSKTSIMNEVESLLKALV